MCLTGWEALLTFKSFSSPASGYIVSLGLQPRWLTKHLPTLASLRKVPVIFVKDKKGGSLRLGELVHLKTAIAIGVKARGNGINQAIEEILGGHEEHAFRYSVRKQQEGKGKVK